MCFEYFFNGRDNVTEDIIRNYNLLLFLWKTFFFLSYSGAKIKFY